MNISFNKIDGLLLKVGFSRQLDEKSIYVVGENLLFSPAFIPRLTRSRLMVHLSGGIGFYFPEFEQRWKASLTSNERKIDQTLPLITSIENSLILNDLGAFRQYKKLEDLEGPAKIIFEFCQEMPSSIDEFLKKITECKILSIEIDKFIHYYSPYDSSNLYFAKSATFISWLSRSLPAIYHELLNCLNQSTRGRLNIHIRDI